MKNEVRLGIIGAGWPGQQHARAIRALPGAELAALAEPNDARSAEFSASYAPARLYQDYTDLLGDRRSTQS